MSKASKWEKGLSISHYSYFASTFEMSEFGKMLSFGFNL